MTRAEDNPTTVGVRDAFDMWLTRADLDLRNGIVQAVERATETALGGADPTYPVAVGDVVALGLEANPAGDVQCPVGQVVAVGPHGVKVSVFKWLIGIFDEEILVRWDRVLEVRWAYRDGDGVFDVAPLGDYQTAWTRGIEYLRAERQAGR